MSRTISEETKEKNRLRAKKYREENKEKVKEYNKKYKEENKEKEKKYREENKEKIKEIKKNYYESNKDIIKDKVNNYYLENKDIKKSYQENNKEKIKEYRKEYKEKNKELIKEYQKEYRRNNKERNNKRVKERKNNDPLFKLSSNIRRTISDSIRKRGYIKESRTYEILGCSFEDFKEYIENQFLEWMNWENYGNPKDRLFEPNKNWDIDHIIPISNAENKQELLELNHYTNLQPLCSYYNRWIKSDK